MLVTPILTIPTNKQKDNYRKCAHTHTCKEINRFCAVEPIGCEGAGGGGGGEWCRKGSSRVDKQSISLFGWSTLLDATSISYNRWRDTGGSALQTFRCCQGTAGFIPGVQHSPRRLGHHRYHHPGWPQRWRSLRDKKRLDEHLHPPGHGDFLLAHRRWCADQYQNKTCLWQVRSKSNPWWQRGLLHGPRLLPHGNEEGASNQQIQCLQVKYGSQMH